MKFYFGATNDRIDTFVFRRLFSYFYYPSKGKLNKFVAAAIERKQDLFLDSGAYTAFTQNKTIDFSEYTDHCLEYEKHYSIMASLDVIGDAEASYSNWVKQKEQGADVMPVFHYGESFDFLSTLVKESSFVGIGGVAQLGSNDLLTAWLDEVWEIIPNGTKVHGFGISSINIIKRYPWFSTDSSSCAQAGALGRLVFFINDRFVSLAVSDRIELALNENEIGIVKKLVSDLGTSLEECRVSEKARGMVNVHAYKKLESLAPTSLTLQQQSLF